MGRRDYIPLKVQLAAALGQLAQIPHEHRKAMTADQIISLFQRHHDPIPKGIHSCDEHWNIQWTIIREHRLETAQKTVPEVSRAKRLEAATLEFRRKMLAKAGLEPLEPPAKPVKPKRSLPSRPLRSRNSLARAFRDGRQRFKPNS